MKENVSIQKSSAICFVPRGLVALACVTIEVLPHLKRDTMILHAKSEVVEPCEHYFVRRLLSIWRGDGGR